MAGDTFFHLAVTIAVVTSTAAGVLALLSWEVFRHSVFGRVVFAFSVLMSVLVVYHVLVLAFSGKPLPIALLESALYTGMAIFVLLMLRVELQLSGRNPGEGIREWR